MKLVTKLLDSLRLGCFEDAYCIKKFWEYHRSNYVVRSYRAASSEEMIEYATADILSCFEKPRNNESFSDFRLSRLNITNWHRFFDKLLKIGYIREADAIETLNSYTLKELKIIADSIGIKKSGKKSEIAERIYSSLSAKELSQITQDENLFIISKSGKEYLSCHSDLALLSSHSAFDVSLAEFNDKRFVSGRKRNFYDTMFQALNEQKFFYYRHKNYNTVSIICLRIYEIMVEEFERTDRNVPIDIMLTNYIEYLYLHVCFPWEAQRMVDSGSIYDISCISLPAIKPSLSKFQDYKSLINFNAVFYNKPPGFMTKDNFIDMINEFFDTHMFDYSKWNNLLQSNFKKYMKLFS